MAAGTGAAPMIRQCRAGRGYALVLRCPLFLGDLLVRRDADVTRLRRRLRLPLVRIVGDGRRDLSCAPSFVSSACDLIVDAVAGGLSLHRSSLGRDSISSYPARAGDKPGAPKAQRSLSEVPAA